MDIVTVGYFFIIALFLGLTILNGLKIKLGLLIKLTGGWLMGIVLLTQIIFWQSYLISFSGQNIILTLVLITLICGFLWHKEQYLKTLIKEVKKIKWRKKIGFLLFFLAWGGLFFIIWRKMLVMEPSGLYAGWVNVWGDWAAHLTYTTSFAYGDNFPPQMPILAGQKFSYPFLANFLSAILIKLGVSLLGSMLIPSFILSMILVGILVGFGGMLTAWIFLLNGGLGFWWWIKDIKEVGWGKIVRNFPREYTHLEKLANIEWINIITSQVVPQRGFLLGFPLAIFIYLLLWKGWRNKKKKKVLYLAGWLTALLPLVHAHSFIMIGFVSGILAILQIFKARKKDRIRTIKKWVIFFLPIVVLGLGQWFWFYSQTVTNKGFIRFQPGWLGYREESILWFWFKNLGIMFFLMIIGFKAANKKLKWFSLPFWGLFLLANLWIFQPWEWDNSKFITHWYLIISWLGALVIKKGLKDKNRLKKMLTGIVLMVAVWAGTLDVWRLTQYKSRKIKFFNNEEIKIAEWVKENTPKKTVFLTADNHDHWLPVLTGRKTFLGFKGWLWTYGLNYSKHEQLVKNMFKGENIEWVNYVIIGPLERAQKIDEEYYDNNFEVVYELGKTRVYKIP